MNKCRACRACGSLADDISELGMCDRCMARLEQSAKMLSLAIRGEKERIRRHRFTEKEISTFLVSFLHKRSKLADATVNRNICPRDKAKKHGVSRYYTGVRCHNGHDSERFTKNGKCVRCCLITQKNVRLKNRLLNTRPTGRPGILYRLSYDRREAMKAAIKNKNRTCDIAREFKCHRNTVINLKKNLDNG